MAEAARCYFEPRTVEQALEILSQMPERIAPLAGGTILARRLCHAEILADGVLDLRSIAELASTHLDGETIAIGPTTTIRQLQEMPALGGGPGRLLADACASFGNPHVRNQATVGGNLASHLPTADLIPALLVLDAELSLRSPGRERTVPLDQYLQEEQTPTSHAELITNIRFASFPRYKGRFYKLALRDASALALVTVAALARFQDGLCADARIALGACGPHALRLTATEERLEGREASPALFADAADEAAREGDVRTDALASAAYRRFVIRNVVADALQRLAADEPIGGSGALRTRGA